MHVFSSIFSVNLYSSMYICYSILSVSTGSLFFVPTSALFMVFVLRLACQKELFLIINTNTDTSIKRPLMKEQIVDCGEETQQTDVGYSRMKTKIETKNSQKNRKKKD
ncbi:hypothetical protein ACB094_06G103300 [Castanea mollissima]